MHQDPAHPSRLVGSIADASTGAALTLEVVRYSGGFVRVRVNEANETHRARRWEPRDILQEVREEAWSGVTAAAGRVEATLEDGRRVVVSLAPLSVELFHGEERAAVLNGRALMNFEAMREKQAEGEEEGAWDERFKTHEDSKPYGPTSVALDISLPHAAHVYGIPEHAAHFALPATRGAGAAAGSDPYRLYNLDVFEYELENPMALYGSVPLLVAHHARLSTAVFWFNAAETWVDVEYATAGSLFSSHPVTHTHWMSEAGLLDVFLFTATAPAGLFEQYTALTGRPMLPPLFALGYHQCKWNYKDEADVLDVNANFDTHGIPYDVIWLDIEHTDGKKYFTWDARHFPTPEAMQSALAATSRRLVTIVDPHIKREGGYYVHEEAQAQGLYVKSRSGGDFEGWCWPGSSAWPDFTDARVRRWWAEKFAYTAYKGSTSALHVWNDMNEPSVFNGPEVTMHKDARHAGGFEHRDVHNAYGLYVHMATHEGLRLRNATERPFILSRAFFAGTQRYGAIWTGDNKADWSHLKIAQPMLLSLAVAGITFAGADVGGFFGNPSAELLARWYQAAAFTPFFRGHAHLDSKRREPWLMGEPYTAVIRAAIRARYALLPYIYTLFAQAHRTGMPVLRPVWVEFPAEASHFAEENTFLLGPHLLVAPVSEERQERLSVPLPPGLWFDYWSPERGALSGRLSEALVLERIPVYLRAGAVVPRKDRPRRATGCMAADPYTLLVAPDAQGHAHGALYVDDGSSYAYQTGAFADLAFTLTGRAKLSAERVAGELRPAHEVERIAIYWSGAAPKAVSVSVAGGAARALEFGVAGGLLVIRKPALPLADAWTVTIE